MSPQQPRQAKAGGALTALSLVIGGIGLVPCVGWIAAFVVGAIGLGAVFLTRFGSREYASAPAPAPMPMVEESAKPKRRTTARKTPSKKQ